jgi:hypothetical protein
MLALFVRAARCRCRVLDASGPGLVSGGRWRSARQSSGRFDPEDRVIGRIR